jgi:hypothetical protein
MNANKSRTPKTRGFKSKRVALKAAVAPVTLGPVAPTVTALYDALTQGKGCDYADGPRVNLWDGISAHCLFE